MRRFYMKGSSTKRIYVLLLLGATLIFSGCASTITASSGGETGIPYYLPKPYLLITKNLTFLTEKITEKKNDKGNTEAIEHTVGPITTNNNKGDSYFFQVIYLPDLTQKYGLEIQSRTGIIKTKVTWIDGWKLVGLNLDADAKTSDIIKAIGEAITQLPIIRPMKGIEKSMGIEGIEKKIEKAKEAGLWLYEIKVENRQLKYELVLHWSSQTR